MILNLKHYDRAISFRSLCYVFNTVLCFSHSVKRALTKKPKPKVILMICVPELCEWLFVC